MMRFLLLLLFLCFLVPFAAAQQIVLGVEANGTDQATMKAYQWRKANVYEQYYTNAGFKVILLHQADKQNVRQALIDHPITHVTGCGHGSASAYTGHRMWRIFETSDVALLKALEGKHVHLLSCQTAQLLGPAIVQHGAQSYAGYHPNFYFTYKSFDHFMEAAAVVDKSFCQGKKAVQAYQATIDTFNDKIAMLSQQEPGAIRYLVIDRDGLRCMPDKVRAKHRCLPDSAVEYALVAQDSVTGEFLSKSGVKRSKNPTISFKDMDNDSFRDLVIAAYEREARDFEVGIISRGKFHRDGIIKSIRQNDEIGQLFVALEHQFLSKLPRGNWEQIVTLKSTKNGTLRAEGTFSANTDLLRSVALRWRGQPDTFSNVKITVNDTVVFDQEALSYEEYSIFEYAIVGENKFVVEASGGPTEADVDVVFADCG